MIENIVLLTVDALGGRHVGHLGYDRDTTPRLDDIARDAVQFTACTAQSSHTRESMPSLLVSTYPSRLPALGELPSDRPALPDVLDDEGFATAAFHSNPYLSRTFGFDRGFDTFDDGLPLARNRLVTFLQRVLNHFRLQPYERAESLNETGLEWLDETAGERSFLWLHYMDPHGPYQPPAEYQRLFRDEVVGQRRAKRLWRRTVDEPSTITPRERDTLVDLYDAEIRYTDEQIGALVDALAERDVLDRTLLVVAADHGDAFGTHDIYGHPRSLYEELIHVPLILVPPEGRSARVRRPVENLDIAPTVLEMAGIEPPPSFEGRTLPVPTGGFGEDSDGSIPPEDRVVFSEATGEGEEDNLFRTAVRKGSMKLHVTHTISSADVETTVLFDLSEDPEESTPLDDEAVRRRLLDSFHEHSRTAMGASDATEGDGDVSSVVEDRLSELGYR
jgi:arylsulfatase